MKWQLWWMSKGQFSILTKLLLLMLSWSLLPTISHLFFIHAAGGCGKTFLCNTIAAEVRRRGQVALCVASSGIAALLLDGERTSHLCFKIPLSIHKDSVTGLKHNSYMFPVLQQTKVIIWDEIPMQHKYDIDAIDQYLRDLLEVSNHLYLIALELTYYLE